MLVSPSCLVNAAEEAGIKVPPDPENFDERKYPHFSVFCAVQLCRRMEPGEHFTNAEVIAKFSEKKIRKITWAELRKAGLKI